eukprot:m.3267 g.3267  ORF g.3267 m.3267 type:complete len:140 (+) comp9202_c0_seq1:259-678(+)
MHPGMRSHTLLYPDAVFLSNDMEAVDHGVAFGSTLDRQLLPLHVPPNRIGNENRLKGESHPAPGSYDNHEVSGFVYQIEKHVESKKGYSLGARTAPRLKPIPKKKVCSKFCFSFYFFFHGMIRVAVQDPDRTNILRLSR